MNDHEPSFWADVGPRYSHAAPGSGAHEMADELTASGTALDDPRMQAASRWRRGAVGEEVVGRGLDLLARPDWAVIHDLTIGSRGANLDHLVIGRPRAFTVNTKHLSGDVVVYGRAVLVSGRKTPFLPKAVAEAARVGRTLHGATGIDAFVWPVLIFHGCKVTIKEQPADVTVLTSSDLPHWFAGQHSQVLSRAELVTLETAARASTTWPTPRAGLAAQASQLAKRSSPSKPVVLAPPVARPPQPVHTVVRWRRFGKDRWYVNDSDGDAMGYYDVVEDRVVCDRPDDEPLVLAALRRDEVIA